MVDLDVIIPAKVSSERVPEKNYRNFFDGWSLVDIQISRVLAAGVKPDRVWLSCEDSEKQSVADKYGINFLSRDPIYARNSTPVTQWIKSTVEQVPGDSDIMWLQVCDPFFNFHAGCISRWACEVSCPNSNYDSLVVCHPVKGFYLDPQKQPLPGWGFGAWHRVSQDLPEFFRMPFTLSILTREALAATQYYVGAKPLWYPLRGTTVDIDTEEDFRIAQKIYELKSRGTQR